MALHKTLLFSALLALAWAQDEEPLTDEEKMKKKHDEVASHPYCMEDNCYELLGVKKDAGGLPIKRAYRKLASEWHPDKNPDPRAKTLFQKYANAYEVLSSPQVSGAHGLPLDAEYTPPLPSQTRSREGAHPAVFGCIRLGSSPVCRCCEDGARDTVLPPSHPVSS